MTRSFDCLLRVEYDKYKSQRLALRPVNNPLGWTDDEDATILEAYQQLATSHDKWVKIAKLLQGRSNYDVMLRWRSKLYKETIKSLDPLHGWTTAEDEFIIKAQQRFARKVPRIR